MVGVTTVALLERKETIGRDLFSRYWRDVHGVMAARIPGFYSYVQYHVTRVGDDGEPFEGIAIVGFESENDRNGLATSKMTGHIHRDEQNVFRRALLYSLPAGAVQPEIEQPADPARHGCFVVVPLGTDAGGALRELRACNPVELRQFDLTGGDPSAWNDTDVDDAGRGRRFTDLFQATWLDATVRDLAVSRIRDRLKDAGVYNVDETHPMVLGGRATPVGLRGLDAVRTIMEAGADNQLEHVVEDALFGPDDSGRA